jgi:hypothetical protein
MYFPFWYYEDAARTELAPYVFDVADLLRGKLVNRPEIDPTEVFQPQFANTLIEQVMVTHACLRTCLKRKTIKHDPSACLCQLRCRLAEVCKHGHLKCDVCKEYPLRDFHSKSNRNYVILQRKHGFCPNLKKEL